MTHTMALLNAKQIFDADDIRYKDVDVPEWGGTVRLRVLSGTDRDRFEASLAKIKNGEPVPDMTNARARLIAWSAVDEGGEKIFKDTDVIKLGQKSSLPISRLFDEACKLSGITPGDVEELTEGFSEGQSEGSTSS